MKCSGPVTHIHADTAKFDEGLKRASESLKRFNQMLPTVADIAAFDASRIHRRARQDIERAIGVLDITDPQAERFTDPKEPRGER